MVQKLRLNPDWDIRLQLVDDPSWKKTGDFQVDCDDKKAILLLNWTHPKQEKLRRGHHPRADAPQNYPLDQVTESLITSIWPEDSPAQSFAYTPVLHRTGADGGGADQVFSPGIRIKPGPVLWPLPEEALVYRPL